MKKLGLISALSLGLLFVSGCTLGTQQSEGSSDVMGVYKEAGEMTCVMTYNSELEQGTSTIYVKDGMIKQETTATVDGETYTVYTLGRDGKMYMWGDMYGEMAGFSMTYDIDVEEELGSFEDMDEDTTISCTKGVKKNSVFDLPKDIEFSSMDDLAGLYDDVNLEGDDTINEEFNGVVEEEVVAEEPVAEEPVVEENVVEEEAVEEVAEEVIE